ncbi:MAG: hypothetical protein AUI42_01765 [Actinobacteria bacterium 13_1_40CM_2_65_8]|nr:MAG: hypothetical protein AUI42_01765 [Actinobacteria bacterium 13_1_40CM_2_65_8]
MIADIERGRKRDPVTANNVSVRAFPGELLDLNLEFSCQAMGDAPRMFAKMAVDRGDQGNV